MKELMLEDFINKNMSDESKKRIENKAKYLIKEFDAVETISSNIHSITDLEDYIIQCIDDSDPVSKTDMKVVLKCLDKLKDN